MTVAKLLLDLLSLHRQASTYSVPLLRKQNIPARAPSSSHRGRANDGGEARSVSCESLVGCVTPPGLVWETRTRAAAVVGKLITRPRVKCGSVSKTTEAEPDHHTSTASVFISCFSPLVRLLPCRFLFADVPAPRVVLSSVSRGLVLIVCFGLFTPLVVGRASLHGACVQRNICVMAVMLMHQVGVVLGRGGQRDADHTGRSDYSRSG